MNEEILGKSCIIKKEENITFQDMAKKSNFQEVYECLLNNYENIKNINIDKVKKGYEQIKNIKLTKNEENFTLIITEYEDDGEKYYDISGIKPTDEDTYSLVFTEWSEWLGFYVEKNLINTMTYSEITAHIFWEMTWWGWTVEERAYNIEIDAKESEICDELEKIGEDFKKNKKILTRDFLERIINTYEKAETSNLKSGIEIIIEELIEAQLVENEHIETIKYKFKDEDIDRAIENFQAKSR